MQADSIPLVAVTVPNPGAGAAERAQQALAQAEARTIGCAVDYEAAQQLTCAHFGQLVKELKPIAAAVGRTL